MTRRRRDMVDLRRQRFHRLRPLAPLPRALEYVNTRDTSLWERYRIMPRPIICVDFDGTIHSYERGWQEGVIYGEMLPGFFEWLMQAKDHFVVAVYSSRSKTEEGHRAMHGWLRIRYRRWLHDLSDGVRATMFGERVPPAFDDLLIFLHEKPAAHLTIDDRAIQFRGQWDTPELDPRVLINFKPWNQQWLTTM